MPGYVIYSMSFVKIIKGGKDIISDGLSWIRTEFLACGRIGQVVIDFAYVKGGVHEAYLILPVECFDDQIWI